MTKCVRDRRTHATLAMPDRLRAQADAYGCFAAFMKSGALDFQVSGMRRKLRMMGALLREMDPELYALFERFQCTDMFFCHRWLLLYFKREFCFPTALRLFEIFTSQYVGHTIPLPVLSPAAAQAGASSTDAGIRGAPGHASGRPSVADDTSFEAASCSFELFFSLALLEGIRTDLMAVTDASDVYRLSNSIGERIEVDTVLERAKGLFEEYAVRKNAYRTCL